MFQCNKLFPKYFVLRSSGVFFLLASQTSFYFCLLCVPQTTSYSHIRHVRPTILPYFKPSFSILGVFTPYERSHIAVQTDDEENNTKRRDNTGNNKKKKNQEHEQTLEELRDICVPNILSFSKRKCYLFLPVYTNY